MGRKSTRANKTVYQLAREEANLTRAQASEILGFIIERRIERIEYGALPSADEVLAMAAVYKKPELCNHYCSHECEIGEKYVPAIEQADNLPAIVLEILSSLNTLSRDKERLIEISADGDISADEMPDFVKIRDKLDDLSLTIDSLKLWLDKKLATGGRK